MELNFLQTFFPRMRYRFLWVLSVVCFQQTTLSDIETLTGQKIEVCMTATGGTANFGSPDARKIPLDIVFYLTMCSRIRVSVDRSKARGVLHGCCRRHAVRLQEVSFDRQGERRLFPGRLCRTLLICTGMFDF